MNRMMPTYGYWKMHKSTILIHQRSLLVRKNIINGNAIGGGSCGSTFAAVVCLKARDNNLPVRPRGQILLR
jgi:acetyl esterase/lipase